MLILPTFQGLPEVVTLSFTSARPDHQTTDVTRCRLLHPINCTDMHCNLWAKISNQCNTLGRRSCNLIEVKALTLETKSNNFRKVCFEFFEHYVSLIRLVDFNFKRMTIKTNIGQKVGALEKYLFVTLVKGVFKKMCVQMTVLFFEIFEIE